MRHIDAADDLQDGVENAELPPIGPDGAPQLTPKRDLPPDPPRLCAAGPCRHYHVFQIQMDAANPTDTGKHGHSYHTNVHHYCYPSPGVETNLGSLPVLSCSRWAPETLLDRGVFARGELALRKLLTRRAYDADLRAFNLHRDATLSDIEEAQRVPEPDEALGVTFEIVVAGLKADVTITVTQDAAIKDAADRAVRMVDMALPLGWALNPLVVHQWFTSADHSEQYEPIDNLDATFAQLGIRHGSRLRVTLTPETKENETP